MSTDSGWSGFLELIAGFIIKNLFAAWLLGATLLFIPSGLADRLAVSTFRDQYRALIGPFTLAIFIFWAVDQVSKWKKKREESIEIGESLHALSAEEFWVLANCVRSNHQTVPLDLHHSVTASLRQKGLLSTYAKSGFSSGYQGHFPHTIPLIVWKMLINDKENILRELERFESQNPGVGETISRDLTW